MIQLQAFLTASAVNFSAASLSAFINWHPSNTVLSEKGVIISKE